MAVIGAVKVALLMRVGDSDVLNEIGTIELPVHASAPAVGSDAASDATASLSVDKADIARALHEAADAIAQAA